MMARKGSPTHRTGLPGKDVVCSFFINFLTGEGQRESKNDFFTRSGIPWAGQGVTQ